MLVELGLDLVKGLGEKRKAIDSIIKILQVKDYQEFLEEEISMAEKMVVAALGGDMDHWYYLTMTTEDFRKFEDGDISEEKLINAVKNAIDNDLRGSMDGE